MLPHLKRSPAAQYSPDPLPEEATCLLPGCRHDRAGQASQSSAEDIDSIPLPPPGEGRSNRVPFSSIGASFSLNAAPPTHLPFALRSEVRVSRLGFYREAGAFQFRVCMIFARGHSCGCWCWVACNKGGGVI